MALLFPNDDGEPTLIEINSTGPSLIEVGGVEVTPACGDLHFAYADWDAVGAHLTRSEVIALRDALTEWIGDGKGDLRHDLVVALLNELANDLVYHFGADRVRERIEPILDRYLRETKPRVYGRVMQEGVVVEGERVHDPRTVTIPYQQGRPVEEWTPRDGYLSRDSAAEAAARLLEASRTETLVAIFGLDLANDDPQCVALKTMGLGVIVHVQHKAGSSQPYVLASIEESGGRTTFRFRSKVGCETHPPPA